MRVRSAVLFVAIVCLLPIAAAADISSISPQSIAFGNVEEFLSIFGSDLSGTESTFVVFDGPGGQFSIQPSNAIPGSDPDAPQFPENLLIAFIPIEVAITPGSYQITVVAKDVGAAAQTLGPVTFTVEAESFDGPPLISSSEILIEEATSSEGAIVNLNVSAQNPNGDPVPVLCSPASGSLFSMGATLATCSATNSFGTSFASIYVLVVDFTPPVVTVPDNINSTTSEVTFTASAVDQIDGVVPVVCSPSSGSTFPAGVTQVVCRAADSSANVGFGIFTVTLAGGLPVITVPDDITVDSPDGGPVVVPYTVTATNGAAITCLYGAGVPFEGNRFYVGTTTLTCTATNLTGSDTKSFTVTVNDLSTPPPVLTVPADIIAEATSSAGAVVNFTVTATNGGIIVCSATSGSTFPLGPTTVSCTATNPGGSDTETFNVTVTDTTPPVLVLPADITAEASSASGAVVTYTASASDLVDGNVAVQCTPASGSTFAVGTTLVSCSASDASGNSASDSFTVTVADTTPPQIISVDASPGVLWPPNHKMVDISVVVIAVDAVDPNPVSHIISVTSSQPVNGTGDGNTAPDWVITGPFTVQLRSERSQGVDRTYTITIETVDDAGNSTTATDTVVVTQAKRRAVH